MVPASVLPKVENEDPRNLFNVSNNNYNDVDPSKKVFELIYAHHASYDRDLLSMSSLAKSPSDQNSSLMDFSHSNLCNSTYRSLKMCKRIYSLI